MKTERTRYWLKLLTFKDAPYPGLLFVTALGILPVTLCAYFFLGLQTALSMNTATKAMAVIGIMHVVCLYALNVRANAIEAFVKPLELPKWGKIASGIVLFMSDGLLLTFLSFRKKRPTALLLSVCMLLTSIGTLLVHLKRFAWLLPYYADYSSALFVCKCVILLALYGEYSRKSMAKLIPFAVAIGVCIALHIWLFSIKSGQGEIKARLASHLNCPVTLAEFRQQVESGASPEEEPLKSLLEYTDKIASEEYPPLAANRQEVQNAYTAFIDKHADFIRVAREFAANPPQRVAHTWKELVYDIELPELSAFRAVAHFLALEMKASPDDRALVASRNHDLMTLRDSIAEHPFLLTKLVSASIEEIRLDALAYTLPYNDYSLDEWQALLGPSPDWGHHFACAIVEETVAQECLKTHFLELVFKESLLGDKIALPLLNIGGVSCHLLAIQQENWTTRHWRFAERQIDFTQAEKRSLMEIHDWDEQNTLFLKRYRSGLSSMFLPELTTPAIKKFALMDNRQMALLAWHVMAYRRAHNGALPDSLDALTGAPVTSFDGRPFEYEHGVVKFSRDDDKTFQGIRLSLPALDLKNGRNYRCFLCVPLE